MKIFTAIFLCLINIPSISKGQTTVNSQTPDTALNKTADMLDEETYWDMIEQSLQNSPNQNEQKDFLVKELEQLSPKEIIGFRLRTDKLLYDTYTSAMWCAGYIMNDGCSDDGFEYFRNWIISRGKNVYYKATLNPDDLINEVKEGMDEYEFEAFWYVALDAFQAKTGKNLYDYIDEDKFKTNEQHYPPISFDWQEDNPESMKKICPQLFQKLWNK